MSRLLLCCSVLASSFFFFFNDTATTEIYTLSLHDALPILAMRAGWVREDTATRVVPVLRCPRHPRSEEHTSELQSHHDLVCRLLLEKKKKRTREHKTTKRTKQQLKYHNR